MPTCHRWQSAEIRFSSPRTSRKFVLCLHCSPPCVSQKNHPSVILEQWKSLHGVVSVEVYPFLMCGFSHCHFRLFINHCVSTKFFGRNWTFLVTIEVTFYVLFPYENVPSSLQGSKAVNMPGDIKFSAAFTRNNISEIYKIKAELQRMLRSWEPWWNTSYIFYAVNHCDWSVDP